MIGRLLNTLAVVIYVGMYAAACALAICGAALSITGKLPPGWTL